MKPTEQETRVTATLPVVTTDGQKREPFVEPKLTWLEPKLVQQGTLSAAAQSGGFFGSFSP